jgi:hypothetical protein
MGVLVCDGATVMCDFAVPPAPIPLVVVPEGAEVGAPAPAATVACVQPENIITFGVCGSPENPAVVAAKAVGSPGIPCKPVLVPWEPGAPNVLINGIPALTNASICQCIWGGTVTVVDPGQTAVVIAG